MKARTRFAPSPTGELHIGGVRTAIFAWLLAKHTGGEFFIRIEDTDQDRYVPGSTRRILESFQWLGIELDGGPDHASLARMKTNEDFPGALADGEYRGVPGPFVQSQRLHLYRQWAEWLVEHGYAYRANETPEELARLRQEAQARGQTFIFREHMRLRHDVRPDEPHVIRMRILPPNGQTVLHDAIRGSIAFDHSAIDDQVLLKMDGFPTYHLAVVVDDHLQGVTHVLRGDDWLPSAPKHVLLYQYFGWPQPVWAHVPNVLGTDGKKLSKRHGAQSVFEFRDQGYIPEALINFLALLGWALGGGEEQNVFTRDELIARFSLEGVGSSPAIFDYAKLDWLNGVHIRMLRDDDLAQRLVPFLQRADIPIEPARDSVKLTRIAPLIKERIKKLTDAAPLVDFFFVDIPIPSAEALAGKLDRADALRALQATLACLRAVEPFEEPLIEQAMRALCDAIGMKPSQLFSVVRVAVTGKTVAPPLFGTIAVLGRETTLQRLARAEAQLR
ncbi:MAG: glutamate--tRNA ligase [Thermoflexales bacterium]